VEHHDEHGGSSVSRRDALKTLAVVSAAAIMPSADLLEAAQKARAARRAGAPLRFFTPAQHRTVDMLAEAIIPADDRSPGARAAQVADYLDFILSESLPDVQKAWTDGIAALDAASTTQCGKPFADAAADQQVALLTDISKNEFNPSTPVEKFFAEAKERTIFGYYTTEIGIHQELKYKGNQFLPEFVGCDHPEHLS
jgi:gluconate 2-dehydrogenase gamma chain